MKLTDLAILFIIIISPILLITNLKINHAEFSNYRKMELVRILDTAVDDGLSTLVEKRAEQSDDASTQLNPDEAVNTFFRTLEFNFNIADLRNEKERIKGYIPVIVIADYDGYWIYASRYIRGADGRMEVKFIKQPKVYYTYEEDGVKYNFTLGKYVRLLSENNILYEGFQGDYEVAKESDDFLADDFENNFGDDSENEPEGSTTGLLLKTPLLEDEKRFEEVRRDTIVELIRTDIEKNINLHNELGKRYGITYHFTLPFVDKEDWYRSIEDISMFAFFQGLPIGVDNQKINIFSFGGAKILKKGTYILTEKNGLKLYHRHNCEEAEDETTYVENRESAAKKGYRPCPICQP